MTKTQANLLDDIRSRLDEPTTRLYTDAELRRWVNQGAADIARRTESLQDRTDIAITAGTREYSLPATIIRANRVEWNATGETQKFALEYRDWQNMDAIWYTQQAVTSARPVYFTMWGFPPTLKIVLYPVPYANGNIKVFHYRLPAELATDGTAATTVLEVPAGWEDCIVDFAEYMALRKDHDPRWQEAKGLYEERIAELYDLTRRWSDQGGVVVPDSPMVPTWLYGDGGW